MLENMYTTKMSANKKQLQNRFTKIRSKSGRIEKAFSFITVVVIMTTMLYATVVMAIMNKQETEQPDNNKIQGTNISYLQQVADKSEAYSKDTRGDSLQQSEFDDENNLISGKAEKQNTNENANNHSAKTDASQTITDKKKIKSASNSEDLYIGFEQIVLSNINSKEIKKELQGNGITQTQSTPVNLEQNFIVNDFKANKTQVTADENGNISIYIAVESDNLFDVQITDSETNEDVGRFTVLANNDNIYSFLGFEKGKNYDIVVKSKTQNDWDIGGNYMLY
ncbi:MAG: hypothetical protein IJN74_00950 [Clostridia bacterium]|nr:hypothetical protein [Clostridia bacterium]